MFKRYKAISDTTITNKFKLNGVRALGSNAGASDSLEVFYIHDSTLGSNEEARVLLKFDTGAILEDRVAEELPVSGSVDFFLKLFNVSHNQTTPYNATLEFLAVSGSWDEGFGKDLGGYTSPGIGYGGYGATWINSRSSSLGPVSWSTAGGDFHNSPVYEHFLDEGWEDIEVNVTGLVEEWIAETKPNDGMAVRISEDDVNTQVTKYLKKMSGRTSEYFFSVPTLEARWNSATKDNRLNFTVSSSLLSAQDNVNSIQYKNLVKGTLKDVALTGSIYVRVFSEATGGTEITTVPLTASKVSTGVYEALVVSDTTSSVMYDRWYDEVGSASPFFTGEIKADEQTSPDYVFSVKNLKDSYYKDEKVRIDIYARPRNWRPNIYSVQVQDAQTYAVENLFYKVNRVEDELEVVPYMTASSATKVSYDSSGLFFDFDMNNLEPGYAYEIKLCVFENGKKKENAKSFKFRVDDNVE